MRATGLIRITALVGLPLITVGFMAAAGQPGTASTPAQPAAKKAADTEEGHEWREKYRDELREHPRIARSLVELHITKDHLEKAPHDFGGHRVDAIKSINESIKQLELAIKFDVKKEDKGGKPAVTPVSPTGK